MINSSNTMYGNAIQNKNKAFSQEEMKASQLDAFAAIVKWRGLEDWFKEWNQYNTTPEITQRYLELNPTQEVADRLIQYANSDEDPYDFALEMWILLTPEEQRIKKYENDLQLVFWDNVPNWVTKVYWWSQEFLQKLWLPIEKIAQWERNSITDADSKWNDEAKMVWAIENYAVRNFWKQIQELDEYETMKALNDLQDEEVLSNYLPNEYKALTDTMEWIWWAVLEWEFPIASELFTAAEDTEVWAAWAKILNTAAAWIWQLLTYTNPALWWIAYKLPSEEDRIEWYSFLWWVWLARWGKWKWNSKWNGWGWISSFIDWIKPKNLYNSFIEWKNNKVTQWKETGEKVLNKWKEYYNDSTLKKEVVDPSIEKYFGPDWETRPEVESNPEAVTDIDYKMKELATKISKWVEDNQRDAVNETLKTLPREIKSNTASIEELSNNIDSSIMKRVIDAENTFYKRDRRKFTKEDIENISKWEVSLEWVKEDPYTVEYWTDPVEDAFRALRTMNEYEIWKPKTVAQARIEARWKKYLWEWLTRLEIAELARDLTKTFKLYKPKGLWQYETITSAVIEPIRRQLKSIANNGYEYAWVKNALTELDKIYSNAATTIELLSDVENAARKERGNTDVQTDTQRLAWKVMKFSKNMWWAFTDILLNNKKLTPDMVNTYMNYLLKVHDNYFDQLGRKWNNFENFMTTADKLAKEMEIYETRPEWEVLDSDNKIWEPVKKKPSDWFDEYVEVVDSTNSELSKAKMDWKNEALNNYKAALLEFLKELWVEEKDIPDTVNYITEPLFEVEEWWKRTDFLGRDVWRKGKTTTPKKWKK